MRGEIIAIGDELTCGRIVNSTSRLAARKLFLLGYEIPVVQSIADDPGFIGQSLITALSRADFVLVTGGLGSTDDDLTTEAAARALGLKTELRQEALDAIRARLLAVGREAELERYARFAVFPEHAEILDENFQMAGYLLIHGGKPIWFLPGVPSQMEDLFKRKVLPELRRRLPSPPLIQRIYRTCGLWEMKVNAMLRPLEGRQGLQLGYYPNDFEVDVSLTVRAEKAKERGQLFRAANTFIHQQLGEAIFGENDDCLPGFVGRLLLRQGMKLVVAESCTGGLLGARITEIPGSSAWFSGGAIVYTNELKEKLLAVSPEILAQYGAVSAECARAMAMGALNNLGGDIALAITGIAGPGGGSAEKPVGTVFIALADSSHCSVRRVRLHGSRLEIQNQTTQRALDMLRRSFT